MRDFGSGTLRERRPGIWQLRVFIGTDPISQRPIQKSRTVHARLKSDAKQALRAFADEVQAEQEAMAAAVPTRTFGQLLEEWLSHAERRLARTTFETYRQYVDRRIKPALGGEALSDLTAHQLDQFYAALQDEGLAVGTIKLHPTIIPGALAQGVKWRWLASNPAREAEPPRDRKEQLSILTVGQVQALVQMAQTENEDMAVALSLAVLTGARRSELCGLKWSDVDWAEGLLRIDRAFKVIAGSGQVIGLPKGDKKRRVMLSTGALDVLRRYEKLQRERAHFIDKEWDPESWLLSYNAGETPFRMKSLTEYVSRLGKRLQPQLEVHLHQLRHFAASHLSGSADPRTVAVQLGHDAQILLEVYSHSIPERARAAAEHLAAVAALPG